MRTAARHEAVPARCAPGDVLAEARGVVVSLAGRSVLLGVDLAVRAGEVVAVVGPNGAGKSTLLAALSGDLRAESGAVLVNDHPIDTWSHTELARRRAVVPQQVTVTFPFTVREVVAMGRSPWARTDAVAEDDRAVADALVDADVAHLANRPVLALSGGERARVALARALAQSSQLLLLDEPTASLDIRHQELVLAVVTERARTGDGAVVVLHDLGLAAAHADRVAVIADGQLVADGPPAAVLMPDRLGAVYHHAVDVLRHPTTGALLVVPQRGLEHSSPLASAPAPAPAPSPSPSVQSASAVLRLSPSTPPAPAAAAHRPDDD